MPIESTIFVLLSLLAFAAFIIALAWARHTTTSLNKPRGIR